MVAKLLDQPSVKRLRLPAFDPLVATTAMIVMVTMVVRFYFGANQPLWLDETFTGAIAALPSITDVLHQSLLDVNAPLYYVIAHAWSSLFGLSNQALRAPALLFGCIAPLLCLIPARGLSRSTSLVWCALIALWAPGLQYSQEARCYTLLLCLSIVSTILFTRLLEQPNRRRGAAWALVGCLAILTHYHALVLIGCQGLAYLALCRTRALRTWPACIFFVPTFVWIGLHAPRIAAFAAPNIAWYRPLVFRDLLTIASFTAGTLAAFVLLAGLCLLAWFRAFVGTSSGAATQAPDALGDSRRSAWVAASCAAVGAAIVIALAFAKPTLTLRYMIPFVPGTLLGLALCCERFRTVWTLAPSVLVILFAASLIQEVASGVTSPKLYNFQAASDALIEAKTSDLVFFWDHPATLIEDPSQLAIVGGFFFERRHVDVAVKPLKVARHEDPNPKLVALAQKPGASILWIYDTSVHDTAASEFPPRIQALAKGLTCHDFGAVPIGIIACSAGAPR